MLSEPPDSLLNRTTFPRNIQQVLLSCSLSLQLALQAIELGLVFLKLLDLLFKVDFGGTRISTLE